jgi:phosphonate transport system substrate-binding protein
MPSYPCSFITVMLAALMAAGIPAGGARAQDCLDWGDLDKKLYCDENRDLLADTPSQGFQLQDPDTLVFSYVAGEDPSVDEKAFAAFVVHLAKKTGRKIRWSDAASSAAQIKAMRVGQVQLAGVSPGPTVYAVNLAGYIPIAVMCRADGTYGYQVQLVVKADSDIKSPADLGGRTVAYVSALSNSGGLEANGSKAIYSGSRGSSISGVLSGKYDAAAVDSNALARMQKQGTVDAKALRIIWSSPEYPSTSFGFAHNLTPDLQRRIHDAFLTFDWQGTDLARVFGAQAVEFCTISYEDTWESLRQLQNENGVMYDVGDL